MTDTPDPRNRFASLAGFASAALIVPLAFAGLAVAAASQADTATERIPVALVNEDELIIETDENGDETLMFAGRGLVTELLADDSDLSFDWRITNAELAEAALVDGDVFAIVTIPDDFSEALLSLSTETPRQSLLDVRTDSAHHYVGGPVAETLGTAMASAFGQTVTTQYLEGMLGGMTDLGSALGDAADGAGDLASGVDALAGGLDELASGLQSAGTGAASLSDGVSRYTGGVDGLSSGLRQLANNAAGLRGVSGAVSDYTGGVSQLSAALAGANAQLQADPTDPVALATVDALSGQLAQLAAGGGALSSQTSQGIEGVIGGITQTADGAAALASGSGQLRSGAHSLAGGITDAGAGAGASADGAREIALGASELAEGLRTGAGQVPANGVSAARVAEVIADPVGVTVTTDNEVADPVAVVSTFFVPLALWLGALAVVLLVRPVTRTMLESVSTGGRLVLRSLATPMIVAGVSAVLLSLLFHATSAVSWMLLPATLGVTLAAAVAFTALHHLLAAWLGRTGIVVSLVLLAAQVTTIGWLIPVEALPAALSWLPPLLPMTHAVNGMQAISAGANWSSAASGVTLLLGLALVSVLVSLAVIRWRRRALVLGRLGLA